MNQTEKLENDLRNNLQTMEHVMNLLNEHLEGMRLKYFENKNIK